MLGRSSDEMLNTITVYIFYFHEVNLMILTRHALTAYMTLSPCAFNYTGVPCP